MILTQSVHTRKNVEEQGWPFLSAWHAATEGQHCMFVCAACSFSALWLDSYRIWSLFGLWRIWVQRWKNQRWSRKLEKKRAAKRLSDREKKGRSTQEGYQLELKCMHITSNHHPMKLETTARWDCWAMDDVDLCGWMWMDVLKFRLQVRGRPNVVGTCRSHTGLDFYERPPRSWKCSTARHDVFCQEKLSKDLQAGWGGQK